jgi:transcriptional regulator with XRE-family HTH domain
MSGTSSNPRHTGESLEHRNARQNSFPKDVDRHVGARIRQRRIDLGIRQQQLAELIGVTNQQAHKYERGINRITAGRLFVIAQALGVDIARFFDGLDDQGRRPDALPETRVSVELARNVASLPKQNIQSAVSALVRALATTGEHDATTLHKVNEAG